MLHGSISNVSRVSLAFQGPCLDNLVGIEMLDSGCTGSREAKHSCMATVDF